MGHAVVLDADHKLLSWSNANSPYAQVARLAAEAFVTKFAVRESGVEPWLAWPRFDSDTFEGINWPHNPAGLYAMLMDSATLWYAFSGDRRFLDAALKGIDERSPTERPPRRGNGLECRMRAPIPARPSTGAPMTAGATPAGAATALESSNPTRSLSSASPTCRP